ncbi:Microsomal glutathione S-transferase 1, partial [Irineochytrium annulatum]
SYLLYVRDLRNREYTIANPVFRAFATGSTLLLAKSTALGLGTVVVRLWTNNFSTEEDRFWGWFLNLVTGGRWAPVRTVDGKKEPVLNITRVNAENHPLVERVKSCHVNDVENVTTLVLLGALYISVVKPTPSDARRVFTTLVVSRYAHTIFYMLGVQPFRGLSYAAGAFTGTEMFIRVLTRLF